MAKQVENPVMEQENQEVINASYNDIINTLVAGGATKFKNLHVKTVNVTPKDNHTMVSFTIKENIPGYVSNDNGLTYEEGIVTTVFTSLYAIVGALKEDEELCWMAPILLNRPNALNLIMSGATIDVLQEHVVSGEVYTNPFSSGANQQSFQHDTIINHVIKFKLGRVGIKFADKLADKMLDEVEED